MISPGPAEPVLFLLGTLEIGGSETKFVRLANRLRALDMPIHLAYLRPPDALLDAIDRVPTVHLGQTGKWSVRAYRHLVRYVGRESIRAIVNVNLYPLTYSVPFAATHRRPAVTNIVSINTSEMRSRRDRAFMHLYSRLLRRVDKLVFGSRAQMHDWLQAYRLPADRALVLHNGVDGQYFSPAAVAASRDEIRQCLGIPQTAFVIVCVSQFRPEKGQRNLLTAVARLEAERGLRPYVLLVGDGVEREAILDCARFHNLQQRTILTGAVTDVRPYLKLADLFVLPSTAVETFSNAALEASAMGVPAVISDLGGAREMFPDGSTGVVYPRDSVDQLVRILASKVGGGQPSTGSRDRVRQETLERFDVTSMTAAWRSTIWPPAAEAMPL